MSPKEEIKKEIGKNSAIEAVLVSEGGQLIITSLKKDIELDYLRDFLFIVF